MPDILDTIDAATGCQQCRRPLGSSPSDDFCGEPCRTGWYATQTQPLRSSDPEAFRVIADQLFAGLREALEEFGRAIQHVQSELAKFNEAGRDNPPTDVRERALYLRRTRNTGPALPPLGRR